MIRRMKRYIRDNLSEPTISPLQALAVGVMLIGAGSIWHINNGAFHQKKRDMDHQITKTVMIFEAWEHCERDIDCILELEPLKEQLKRVERIR